MLEPTFDVTPTSNCDESPSAGHVAPDGTASHSHNWATRTSNLRKILVSFLRDR